MFSGISLSKVASPGAGVGVIFDKPVNSVSLMTKSTGSPGAYVVALEVSQDGINFVRTSASIINADGITSLTNTPVLAARAYLVSFSPGATPATVSAWIAGA